MYWNRLYCVTEASPFTCGRIKICSTSHRFLTQLRMSHISFQVGFEIIMSLNTSTKKGLSNHLSDVLILQMKELRPGSQDDLFRVNQMVSGRDKKEFCQSHSQCRYESFISADLTNSFSKKQLEAQMHFTIFCKKNDSEYSFIPREQYSTKIRFKNCQQ